jgi:hypothetical protein
LAQSRAGGGRAQKYIIMKTVKDLDVPKQIDATIMLLRRR